MREKYLKMKTKKYSRKCLQIATMNRYKYKCKMIRLGNPFGWDVNLCQRRKQTDAKAIERQELTLSQATERQTEMSRIHDENMEENRIWNNHKTIKPQKLTLSEATKDQKQKCPAFIMELKNRIWIMLHDWTNEYLHNCEHSWLKKQWANI